MSKSKSIQALGLLTAMAMGSNLGMEQPFVAVKKSKRPLTTDEKKIKLAKSKGLTEYFYGENSLFARDKKNADRKAKNKGWI